ncbi:DUF4287 domain-containing protein [Crocinitomix catalasitica]|nr:DUF4287 domain-containing protein [Crocinitomix catalasitica]
MNVVEMRKAIIRNLPEKTGFSIEHWVDVVRKSQITDKKEAVSFLKQIHSLGHFQAETVFTVWNDDDVYLDGDGLESSLVEKSNEMIVNLYKSAHDKIMNLGNDVSKHPCKTYTGFSRSRQFVVLKPKKSQLIVGFAFENEPKVVGLTSAKGIGGSDRVNFKFEMKTDEDLATLDDLLKSAYSEN